MQTSTSRNGTSEEPQKTSRKLKVPASYSDSVPSPDMASGAPKHKSPKVTERKSPCSPATEKRHPTKVSELESQLAQVQEELMKTKDLLSSSESTAKRAQKEAVEAKNEQAATSAKLEASQKQLIELFASKESEAEKLEATQNQLSSDLNNLRFELAKSVSQVEKLKKQLIDCEKSESYSVELLTDAQVKLHVAKTIEENLRDEVLKSKEAFKSVAMELEKLKTQKEGENEGLDKLMLELNEAKADVKQLKYSLDSAAKTYQEEIIQSTLLIESAHEQVEQVKTELATREVEMRVELERTKADLEQLKLALDLAEKKCHEQAEQMKAELDKKEAEMGDKLEMLNAEIVDLEAKFESYKEGKNKSSEKGSEMETILQNLENKNQELKAEFEGSDTERKRENEEMVELVKSARASEREALMKVVYLTEEADNSNQKAAHVVEQLEVVKGTNGELEAELRRLKVQSDQWRLLKLLLL